MHDVSAHLSRARERDLGKERGRRIVLGATEVAIEDASQGIARQVLEAGGDRQRIGVLSPRPLRFETPRALAGADGGSAAEWFAGRLAYPQAVLEDRAIEGPIELDDEGIERVAAWMLVAPRRRIDARPNGRSYVIAPCHSPAQRTTGSVGKRSIDRYDDRVPLDERISGLEVRRQPALDAAGVEQEREPRSRRIPQFGRHLQEDAFERLTVIGARHAHGALRPPLGHGRREVDVEPERIDRQHRAAREY